MSATDDPFAVDDSKADPDGSDGGADGGGDGGDGGAGPMDDKYWGLRNTEPSDLTPEEVGRQLDLEAEWWQHLGTGFIKQTGGGGAEAWMHYVMALFLLVAHIFDALPEEEGSDGSEGESTGNRGEFAIEGGEEAFE